VGGLLLCLKRLSIRHFTARECLPAFHCHLTTRESLRFKKLDSPLEDRPYSFAVLTFDISTASRPGFQARNKWQTAAGDLFSLLRADPTFGATGHDQNYDFSPDLRYRG